MLGSLVLLASLGAPVLDLTPASLVTIASRDVRVSDVVPDVALTADLRRRVIARLPAGVASVRLKRCALALLVRRAAPSLPIAPASGDVTVRLQRKAVAARPCFALDRDVAADAILGREMLVSTACASRRPAPVRFASGLARAGAPLAAGAYLGAVTLDPSPAVHRGDALRVVSTMGPVRITRAVTAMQDAHAGRHVFVRDADGVVFTAPLQASGEMQ